MESVRQYPSHVGHAFDRNMVLNEIKKETFYHIEYYRKFLSLQNSDPVAYESDIGDIIIL